MQIKLVWENPNVIATTTKVYRGTQPLDRANLSNPLATLTQGETTWTDTTAIAGQRYYYVLESLSARDRAVSHNIEAWALPRTGPGPQTLLGGDHEVGYYGDVASANFITLRELRAALNFNAGNTVTDAPVWMKFAYKGKTLFIPAQSLATGISWKALYDAGLVYGTNDDGSSLYTGAKVNQRRTVKIGLETFIVRLMTTAAPRPDRGIVYPGGAIELPTQTIGSEWDELMYRVSEWVPSTQRGSNIGAKTRSDFNNIGICLTQELVVDNPTSCVIRGTTSLSTKGALSYANISPINGTAQWRPVLELIPDYQVNLSF